MPRERVTMRKIREILRLVWGCNQSRRDTATACGVGKTTVDDMIRRATAAGLAWPVSGGGKMHKSERDKNAARCLGIL